MSSIRLLLAPLALTVAVLMAAPAAFAGGWAVTTLDAVPSTINAGQPYAIGYSIRQHGSTPFVGASSAIEVRTGKGSVVDRFIGVANGPPGHYVAQVTFREAGDWAWAVDQSPFQPQELGTITVVPAAPASQAVATMAVLDRPDPLLALVPSVAMLAVGILAWRLVAYLRPRRVALR